MVCSTVFDEGLEMAAEPTPTEPDCPANAAVRETFGEEPINEDHSFGRNGSSGVIQGEPMSAGAAQVPLFADMGVTVFDDIDALTRWTCQTVHAPSNCDHS